MEWINSFLSNEWLVLVTSISLLCLVFSWAALKAYLTHLAKMRRIKALFGKKNDGY